MAMPLSRLLVRDKTVTEFLDKHTVKDLETIATQKTVRFETTDTATECLDKLLAAGVASAPVFDSKTKTYAGFVDLRDLVSYALHDDDFKEVETGVVACVNFASPEPLVTIPGEATLSELVRCLEENVLHRCLVVREGDDACAVLSQSVLVQFLDQHAKELKATLMGSKTLQELGGFTKDLISFQGDWKLRTMFETLARHSLNGAPVLDAKGGLLGNLSHSDFRILMGEDGAKVGDATYNEYLHHWELQTLGTDATLTEVIHKFAETGLHRLYLTRPGEKGKGAVPLGVVTLSDVMRSVANMAALLPGDNLDEEGRLLCVFVDSTEGARDAFNEALATKKDNDALLVVHAIEMLPPIYAPHGMVGFVAQNAAMQKAGKTLLRNYLKLAKAANAKRVHTILLASSPSWKADMVAFANNHHVDQVFVGSRGLAGFTRWVLGSTAEYLVKNAHANVLVVRSSGHSTRTTPSANVRQLGQASA